MMKNLLKGCWGLIFWALIAAPVYADGSSQSGGETAFTAQEITTFAKKVEKTLASKGAYVAILARMGRPAADMPEGMHYTHVAFAVYSQITTGDGRKVPGYAIYNLYQNNEQPDVSTLVQDFPVDFFGGVAVLEAGVLIPSIELQKRLLEVIRSPTYKDLHDPHYSLIANPYTLGRQNCTEHTLDVINAAIYETSDIKVIKANEKAYFKAQRVNVNPVKLFFGSMFSAQITTVDQPTSTPETATFETIAQYLQKYDQGAEVMTIVPDASQAAVQ
jgi:hypothetical protein